MAALVEVRYEHVWLSILRGTAGILQCERCGLVGLRGDIWRSVERMGTYTCSGGWR